MTPDPHAERQDGNSAPDSSGKLANAVFVVVALVMLGLFVRRELTPQLGAVPDTSVPGPRSLGARWETITGEGRWIGPRSAPIAITVFADFECPVCRSFALGPLQQVRSVMGDSLAVVFRHLPIPRHRFAYHAAKAAECAAEQGRFAQFHDAVFMGQDSLGLKAMEKYAIAASVPDMGRFSACVGAPGQVAAIERDLSLAADLGVSGTPSIIIGDKLYSGALGREQLESAIREDMARSTDGL